MNVIYKVFGFEGEYSRKADVTEGDRNKKHDIILHVSLRLFG